jgi:hypothetical protein
VVALDHRMFRGFSSSSRTVRRAKLATMSERLGYDVKSVRRSIEWLLESGIVLSETDSFKMSEPWRTVLPEIVSPSAPGRCPGSKLHSLYGCGAR